MTLKTIRRQGLLPPFLSVLLFCFYAFFEAHANPEAPINVTRASRDIEGGRTIGPDDVNDDLISRTALPPGIPAHRDAVNRENPIYYLTSKSDAIGRLSMGLRKGQLLFFDFPGYRGCTVVIALKDIPRGALIEDSCISEAEISPRKIPALAIDCKKDAVGKRSNGVLKGQAITCKSDASLICSGEFPKDWVGYKKRTFFLCSRKNCSGHKNSSLGYSRKDFSL